MSLQYDKTNWIDRETPVDAERLNKVEDVIEYLMSISHDIPKSELSRIESEQLRRGEEDTRRLNEIARNKAFDSKIIEVDSSKSELISSVNSTVSNKINEVNRVKDSLKKEVSDKITEIDAFTYDKNMLIDNKVKDLEGRFGQLTSQQQQEAEVIDARVGVDGYVHSCIKNRIDSIETKPTILYETVEG